MASQLNQEMGVLERGAKGKPKLEEFTVRNAKNGCVLTATYRQAKKGGTYQPSEQKTYVFNSVDDALDKIRDLLGEKGLGVSGQGEQSGGDSDQDEEEEEGEEE